jgi:hypothetical protein
MKNALNVDVYDIPTNTKLALNYGPGVGVEVMEEWLHPISKDLFIITDDGKATFLHFTTTTITPSNILTVPPTDNCVYSDYLQSRDVFMIACTGSLQYYIFN